MVISTFESFDPEIVDAYNAAVRYLLDKYPGYKSIGPKASERLSRARNKKDFDAIHAGLTQKDYVRTFRKENITDKDDLQMMLLVDQYHYGYGVKSELENLVKRLGIKK